VTTKFAIAVLRGSEHQFQVFETAEELERAWDKEAESLQIGSRIAAGYLKVRKSGDREFMAYKSLKKLEPRCGKEQS
jgi:hypothetical protein